MRKKKNGRNFQLLNFIKYFCKAIKKRDRERRESLKIIKNYGREKLGDSFEMYRSNSKPDRTFKKRKNKISRYLNSKNPDKLFFLDINKERSIKTINKRIEKKFKYYETLKKSKRKSKRII